MATARNIARAKRNAVGGRRPRCRRGKSCSAACINRLKKCLVDMPAPISGSLARAVKAIRNRSIRYRVGRRAKYAKTKLRQKARYKRYQEAKRIILGNMAYMAMLGKKGSYDSWEKKLMSLQVKAGKKWKDPEILNEGEVWRSHSSIREKGRLGKWDKAYKNLISRLDKASKDGNRGTYLKLEKGLLKLLNKAPESSLTNPIPREIAKGLIWASNSSQRQSNRANRIYKLAEKVRGKMKEAAEGMDRSNYLKLQRKLLLLDKEYYRLKGGVSPTKEDAIWKTARAEIAENRFRNSLLKTVRNGDRDAFNRLIERHSKVSKGYDKNMWNDYQRMASIVNNLQSSALLKSGKSGISLRHEFSKGIDGKYRQAIFITSKVLGNKLEIKIKPNSFSFKVNDSFMAGDLSRREAIALGKEVKRQFTEIVKNLNEGMAVEVTAARGRDGKVGSRKRSYARAGFYLPVTDYHDSLFGVVKGGRIRPITEDEFLANKKDLF